MINRKNIIDDKINEMRDFLIENKINNVINFGDVLILNSVEFEICLNRNDNKEMRIYKNGISNTVNDILEYLINNNKMNIDDVSEFYTWFSLAYAYFLGEISSLKFKRDEKIDYFNKQI